MQSILTVVLIVLAANWPTWLGLFIAQVLSLLARSQYPWLPSGLAVVALLWCFVKPFVWK